MIAVKLGSRWSQKRGCKQCGRPHKASEVGSQAVWPQRPHVPGTRYDPPATLENLLQRCTTGGWLEAGRRAPTEAKHLARPQPNPREAGRRAPTKAKQQARPPMQTSGAGKEAGRWAPTKAKHLARPQPKGSWPVGAN